MTPKTPAPLKPSEGWVVVDGKAKSLSRPLTALRDCDGNKRTVQMHFGSFFFLQRDAKDLSNGWPGSRVVKVRIVEVGRG